MNAYQRACHGKARFPNRATARLRHYECRFCHLWHLGNPPGKATHLRRGQYGPIPVTEYPT